MSNYITINELPSINLSNLSGNEYFILNDVSAGKLLLSDLSTFITDKNSISNYGINLGNYTNINFTGINITSSGGVVTVPLESKVDVIPGKGLSTNDFTNTYKLKLDNLIDNIPVATINSLGVVKIGNNIDINDGTISVDLSWSNIDSKPSSLADLGLSDVYSKVETDNLLSNKQDKNSLLTNIINITNNGLLKYHNGVITYDNSNYLTSNQIITITGDASARGSTNLALTLNNVGTAGTYIKVTTDNKGRVISGTNPTNIGDLGITDVYTKTETESRIQDIIGAAPAALDTLGEIANQLADDESVVSALITTVSNKVDKITGKGLSTEDYTTSEKSKLAGIAAGAEVNVNADWNSTSGDAQILNKPTTVAGYGLTDVYTKTEVQTVLPIIGLDTTTSNSVNSGQITWNIDEGTADLGLLNGSSLQIGQENVRLVRNSSGSTILNGTVCMFDGTIGNSGRINVKPFTAGFNEAMYIYGVATQDILNGADGYITIDGKVRGINTTGSAVGETWNDGDVLYIKPNDTGKLTKVVPAVNELRMPIAAVIHAHTNGTLEIRFSPINENQFEPRNSNIQSHIIDTNNPHAVTKTQVGLGNVDNTADISKSVLSATKLTTTRNIALTGDVTGNINFDGSANVSIATTIAANSVALGTDTTGNYVAGVTQGTGISVTGTAGEGWSPTVALTNVGTAGTYRSVTTDAQGRVTAGTNPTTVAGYGLTDVYTKTESDAALVLKAPLVSPALTGTPTAPTAAVGTNTTQVATTAYVVAEIDKIEEW